NWSTIVKKRPEIATKIYQNIALDLKNRLNHSNNKLVTLFATGKIIATYDNLDKIAAAIIKIILQIIPSNRALFITFSKITQRIHIHQSVGYNKVENNTYYNISKDNLLRVLVKEPETKIISKNNWPKGSEDVIYKSNFLIITPIQIQKRVLGFIILGDKENKREFSINNKILLEAITSQVAPAIEDIASEQFRSAAEEVKKVYIDPFIKNQ
ncbi:GAF domain-containing protein, partial [bacterium]|nr:GAF domain-containing protein [bacterium]